MSVAGKTDGNSEVVTALLLSEGELVELESIYQQHSDRQSYIVIHVTHLS